MINWQDLLTALALLLVFEGLMPFIAPDKFKQRMLQIQQVPDATLRIIGGVSMLAGIVFLYWVR